MKALVVGGTGPSGPYVVQGLMERGYEVTILHRGAHEVELPAAVRHIHGDPHFVETLETALGGLTCDLVVSMYGRLRHVAEVMKGRTSRFIGIGGLPYRVISARGSSRFPERVPVPIPESAPLITDEEESKFAYRMAQSEQAVLGAHSEGHYSATMLRFPLIYGPRQLAPPEWSIIRRLREGRRQIIVPDAGLQLCGRSYAENAAQSVMQVVDKPAASGGEIYNVGEERSLTLRQWIQAIASVLGAEVEFISMPFHVARTTRVYNAFPFHVVMDLSKIKSLGYRDVVPVEEAVARTVKWYLDNPPARGGEVEKQLGDAFDYKTEDRIIQEFGRMTSRLRELADVGYRWRHPYAHPKAPGNAIDCPGDSVLDRKE